MQTLNAPGTFLLNSFFSASTNVAQISSALNVRGVIISDVSFNWYMGAINSAIQADLRNLAGTEFAANFYDDNGATGPINQSKAMVFPSRYFFAAGVQINFNISIVGTGRLTFSALARIL